jgi:3-hydroxy-5-phosphonooxypentane-2,4-dione thiolase
MDWGLSNRLSRIIKPETKRTVMLAFDHGYFLGPITRLENPKKTIEPLLPFCDAIMLTRGVLRTCFASTLANAVVLRVSGGSSIIGADLANEQITASVKDAMKLNASAVALSIFVGTAYEQQTLVNLARLIDDSQDQGLPVLAVTAVGKELEKRDAKYLALACRIAAELGAHFVKTYYCEDFEKVANSCPVPLVIAGGPKLATEHDVLLMAYNALQDGACGVDFGRNIWQSDYPIPMIRAIRALVHEDATVKDAYELFKSLKSESK